MKKYISILLIMFLTPVLVNAETLEYNICKNGCEYNELSDVLNILQDMRNNNLFNGQDIVINFKDSAEYSISDSKRIIYGGTIDSINSIQINGNNSTINVYKFEFVADTIQINNVNLINNGNHDIEDSCLYGNNVTINNVNYLKKDNNSEIKSANDFSQSLYDDNTYSLLRVYAKKLDVSKLQVAMLAISPIDINSDIFFKLSNSEINALAKEGNLKVYNSEIYSINNSLGSIDVYNSIIGNITNSLNSNSLQKINCYNCDFYNKLSYIKFYPGKEIEGITEMPTIFDYAAEETLVDYVNTYVYFDKEAKLKPGDKLNLADYLDYYTEDKEIEYTIEDESIAKIENKELIGLKEGSTKVTVTTDDGHVVYNINLVVEKETIPEKIDKKTIKVPITGNRIKAWVLVVSTLLLGVILGCIYMLIKSKKVTK